jgi:hypothetical protein
MDTTKLIAEIAAEDATIPDIRELLAYVHHFLGGTQQYAEMLARDVKAAPEGSTQRLSFHNNYLTAIAKFGGNDELKDVDRTALEAEAKRIMEHPNGDN